MKIAPLSKSAFACADVISAKGRPGWGATPAAGGAGEAPESDAAGEAAEPGGVGFEAEEPPDGGLLVCGAAALGEGIAIAPSPEAAGGLPSQSSLRSRRAVAFERAAATTESATMAAVSRQNLTGAPGVRRRGCISTRCSRR